MMLVKMRKLIPLKQSNTKAIHENDGMVSPLKRHRNVPNLELNNQVNKVRRPRWILQRLGWI